MQVPRRAVIFHVADLADAVYVLLHGLVKVSYFSLDGTERIIDLCLPGDLFGELFLGKYRQRIGTAVAQQACVVASITKNNLHDLVIEHPEVGWSLIGALADDRRDTLARLHALMHINARHRFMGILLSLARRQRSEGHALVQLPALITQEDLANLACINRATASLLLNQLRREGIIDYTTRQITVDIMRLDAALTAAASDLLE